MESAAHHFICIRELYDLLLVQLSLEENPSDKTDRVSIARLARASRLTSGPALDVLWSKVTRPSQIMRLFPEDALQLAGMFGGEYTLLRPLKESDFVAFDKYAPRVHFVDFSKSFTGLGAGCEFLSTIKMHRNPIFPHLRSFEWHPTTRFNTVGAFHLISREHNVPRDEFALTMWGNISSRDAGPRYPAPEFFTGAGLAETIDSFRSPLSSWLPDVPSLSINTGNYLAKQVLLQGLQSLSKLQHFYARASGSLGAEILDHLALLPNLKTLHIGDEDEKSISLLHDSVRRRELTTGSASFPALESLEIYGPYLALTTFVMLITSQFLHAVCLNVTDAHPIDSSIFFELTAPSGRSSLLRHFAFYTQDHAVADHERRAVFSMTSFEPLLACRNLETLDINFDAYKVEFDDADLEKMANAWPHLETLKVFSRYTQQFCWADPQVHLYTLWSLVEKCRNIRRIEMPVDARVCSQFVPPRYPSHTRPATSGSFSMEKIGFFLSPCGSPAHVAAFLNFAFPHLIEFFAGPPKNDGTCRTQTWAQVREALPGVDRMWRALRLAHATPC
ncbi:hypothetical protein R3P38DRAFT_2837250 [Favolaschia claudopus]|uniref:Uncharacterized protein n=1 Tax=Favolaschia claudopus TaxID=2862362 RepID=A0AAW0E780_9AGAR